jgi:hypothetical protein
MISLAFRLIRDLGRIGYLLSFFLKMQTHIAIAQWFYYFLSFTETFGF